MDDDITHIGNYAFNKCQQVETIDLPENLETIGKLAFCWNGLTNVTIPSSVTTIGPSAFDENMRLTDVYISDGVTAIGNGAFADCFNLNSVRIPPSVTMIEKNAFNHCASRLIIYGETGSVAQTYAEENGIAFCDYNTPQILQGECGDTLFWGLNEESGLLTIIGYGDMMDYNATELPPWNQENNYIPRIQEIYFDDNLTHIGDHSFRDCIEMRTVDLPRNLVSIGTGALLNTGLKYLVTPESVRTIGGHAFAKNEFLQDVYITEGASEIGFSAFWRCTALRNVTIPASVEMIGQYAFSECSPDLVIYGTEGSYAQTYAEENGIPFSSVS